VLRPRQISPRANLGGFHSTTLGRYRLTLDETSSVLSFAISLFGCLSNRATAQPQYSRHGDQDRYPFPVPLRVYDQTIQVLKSAVQKAKLGRAEELGALKRLDDQARQLERHATGPTVQELIAQESGSAPHPMAAAVFLDASTVEPRRRSGTSAVDEPQPQTD